LSLAKECYSMKLDLLTNATVVDDAIRFVEEKSGRSRTTDASTHLQSYHWWFRNSRCFDYGNKTT
jgi:hypothetical protein